MMNAFVSRRPKRVPAHVAEFFQNSEKANASLGETHLRAKGRLACDCYGHLVTCLLAIFVLTGCESKPDMRLVEGNVTYAGQPLDHGMLGFRPTTGKLAGAPILPDGKYAVELSPGDYQVTVNSPPKLPEGFQEGDPLPPPDPNALPEKYNRQETEDVP